VKNKSTPKPIQILIDGKQGSIKAIARDRGGEEWKSFIENMRGCKKEINEYLYQQLGDYLDSTEIRKLTGIEPKQLSNWIKAGLLEGIKFKSRWYYSKSSLAKVINKKQ
jgi:hypothetical protein